MKMEKFAAFKAYDIRGVYGQQFNEEDAWKIGCATARFLPSLLRGYERGQANMQSICVGRDMRTHSESLVQALIEGMISTGTNVIDIGMIDTPQMYFAINCWDVRLEKKAVQSGYWSLFRYNPLLEEEGKNPFQLDSKEPDWSKFQDFLKGEVRYTSLTKSFPAQADELFAAAEDNAKWRHNSYKRMAAMDFSKPEE